MGSLVPSFDYAERKKDIGKDELLKLLVQESVQDSNIHPNIIQHYQTCQGSYTAVNQELIELTKSKGDASTQELQKAWQDLELEIAQQHSSATGVPLDMGSKHGLKSSSKKFNK